MCAMYVVSSKGISFRSVFFLIFLLNLILCVCSVFTLKHIKLIWIVVKEIVQWKFSLHMYHIARTFFLSVCNTVVGSQRFILLLFFVLLYLSLYFFLPFVFRISSFLLLLLSLFRNKEAKAEIKIVDDLNENVENKRL